MTDQPLFALPFEEILRRTAARTSYPGGGAASAMACATAASLVAMAGRFTGDAAADAVARAETAIDELAGLAQADAEAFGELLAAWRIPREEPGRQERVAAAALHASQVPLRICRIGVELARHAAWLAREGKADLRGDAYTAAELARAGVRSAAQLVELNACQATDPEAADEARRLVDLITALADEMERAARGSAQ
jgi:formiminotetrahydrofolate cyclodeaminase